MQNMDMKILFVENKSFLKYKHFWVALDFLMFVSVLCTNPHAFAY